MKKNKILISLFSYLSGVAILQIFLDALINKQSVLFYSFGLVINQAILIIVFYFCNREDINAMLKSFKRNYKKNLKNAILFWIIGFVAVLLINYIVYSFISSDLSTNETLVREQTDKFLIASLINFCFLGPILEEIVFRLSFNQIKHRFLYLITTSLVFALMHIISDLNTFFVLLYILPYLALGLTFGLAYQRTNNLFTSIITHSLHNTLTTLIILLF